MFSNCSNWCILSLGSLLLWIFCIMIILYDCIIVGKLPLEHRLTQLATFRLTHAFSDSTKKAYTTLFRTFLAFVVFMSWDVYQVIKLNLLCFLECLQYNGVKYTQMANYWSAIKTKFLILGLDVACFDDSRLKYYQKVAIPSECQIKESY